MRKRDQEVQLRARIRGPRQESFTYLDPFLVAVLEIAVNDEKDATSRIQSTPLQRRCVARHQMLQQFQVTKARSRQMLKSRLSGRVKRVVSITTKARLLKERSIHCEECWSRTFTRR